MVAGRRRARPESTASIIQEELRLIFRGARRQGVAALCHQQVLVAIAIASNSSTGPSSAAVSGASAEASLR